MRQGNPKIAYHDVFPVSDEFDSEFAEWESRLFVETYFSDVYIDRVSFERFEGNSGKKIVYFYVVRIEDPLWRSPFWSDIVIYFSPTGEYRIDLGMQVDGRRFVLLETVDDKLQVERGVGIFLLQGNLEVIKLYGCENQSFLQ